MATIYGESCSNDIRFTKCSFCILTYNCNFSYFPLVFEGGTLNGTHFYILFVVTAAGVVLCGSPKKQPRTSSIVQFIFCSFWSFEIGGNILRNQKILFV